MLFSLERLARAEVAGLAGALGGAHPKPGDDHREFCGAALAGVGLG